LNATTEADVTNPVAVVTAVPDQGFSVTAVDDGFEVVAAAPVINSIEVVPAQSSIVTVDNPASDVTAPDDGPFTVIAVDGPPGARGQAGNNAAIAPVQAIGVCDGVNVVFTIPDAVYVSGSTQVYRNGALEYRGIHYDETAPNEITLRIPALSNDDIFIGYQIGQ
jgi:hypothetical protein